MKPFLKNMLLVGFFLTMLTGCADDRISRKFPCRFTLYTTYHNPCMILTAITSANYPVMVSVKKNSNGLVQIYETDRTGKQEVLNVTNEVESRAYSDGIYLGANNSIIVCQESYDAKMVAYDGQCPNCINENSNRNYPLQFYGTAMQVKCSRCGRIYSLDYGSVLSGAKNGDRLMEYAVSYDATHGRLYIGN